MQSFDSSSATLPALRPADLGTDTRPEIRIGGDRPDNGPAATGGRLLLLSEVFPPAVGGSGRYLWELLRRMPPERVLVAAGECDGDEGFDAAQRHEIVRLNMALKETGAASWGGMNGYARIALNVIRLCRRERVAALWCARSVTEGWVGWLVHRVTGLPYFVSAHGEDLKLPTAEASAGVMTSRQHRWMARRILRGTAGVIANSENTKGIVRSEWGVPDAKMHILTPGVDSTYFTPAAPCPRTRARLGWDGRRVVLTVGRLVKRKGHDLMIDALRRVRDRMPDVLYAVMGDGPELARLKALAAEHGVQDFVRFYGATDERVMLQGFQQCDLFALPNRQVGTDIEGFGIVLLEAQACGKPVLAGASGGTAEAMCAPKTGLLVDCTRPEPLASAVTDLLGDPQRLAGMGRAAREFVVENFEWDRLSNRVVDLLTNLVAAPPR